MFGREKAPQRFVVKESHGAGLAVICDTATGVHYLATIGDGAMFYSGITPLLDENGHVVIDKHLPE